jgi:sugar phosphate isomerase/epimerase
MAASPCNTWPREGSVLLGFNTNGLQNHRLEDGLRLLGDAGFEAVALTPDVMHLDPYSLRAAAVRRLSALLDRLGLAVVMETGARFLLDPRLKHEPTLMSRDPQARARRVDYYRRVAEIGADLGARVVSFWSGTDRWQGPDSDGWLREGVSLACEVIRDAGLTPGLEPEPGMAVETVEHYLRLHKEMGTDAPGLTLDVGHLYANCEGEPGDIIPRCGGEIVQVHVEDMKWGVHQHLPPGEGDMDFAAVREALQQVGYQGTVCFELSRSSHRVPEVLTLCRRVWRASHR